MYLIFYYPEDGVEEKHVAYVGGSKGTPESLWYWLNRAREGAKVAIYPVGDCVLDWA